jgi:RNA recognition motif-containing protein
MLFHGYVASSSVLKRIVFFYFVTEKVSCLLMAGVCLQARAVKNLWVGGISPTISKQDLEEEFQKFGKIEGIAFSRDQTSAYIDFEKLEEAISAHRALNGTELGGNELCVDYQRSRGRAVSTCYC